MSKDVVLKTELTGVKLLKRGKVRDVYDLGDVLLIVSTDRISCFDVVLPTGIPRKGEILTRLSLFWFELTKDIINDHLISSDIGEFPKNLTAHASILKNRSMLVKKSKVIPIECVVRGYLSGSGWKEYRESQSVCGIRLPAGMKESDKLPEPIFTPSTKEDVGHDINVSQDYVKKKIGKELADLIREKSLALYIKARDYAESRGIIIADTKFEFGLCNEEVILIDEVLTPDSSRFWPKDEYTPGKSQPSFDKQFVRDYLETLNWDKTPPGPELPTEVVKKTTQKYLDAFQKLTGVALN